MKTITALLLLLPVLASAAFSPHLKNDTPNELAYHVSSAHCPYSDDGLAEIIRGVLVRSRIKPRLHQDDDKELYIYVVTQCYAAQGLTNFSYHIDVGFGQRIAVGGWTLPVRFMFSGYGSSGLGPREMILGAVKERTEAAVTEYLKANFDLGEDDE